MDELDDLFRQELDGHTSEPSPDLWARLQARTAAEGTAPAEADPVDVRFRTGLAGHATPPQRALWERLEDEHLRPRQRRRPVVAWGRLAVAASLLLLVLAGGAGLWRHARGPVRGSVATTSTTSDRRAGRGPIAGPRAAEAGKELATQPTASVAATAAGPTTRKANLAATVGAVRRASATIATAQAITRRQRTASADLLAVGPVTRKKTQKISTTQATGVGASPSSSPVASTAARHRPAPAPRPVPGLPKATPPPDAAAGSQLALGGRKTPSSQPTTPPATPALAAAPPQVIEVEVRRGSRPAAAAAELVVAAAPAAEPRPHFRLGGLLRQAGRAVRGESVSLAEATGLPEAVTVQAHLGDRVVSRTIRL